MKPKTKNPALVGANVNEPDQLPPLLTVPVNPPCNVTVLPRSDDVPASLKLTGTGEGLGVGDGATVGVGATVGDGDGDGPVTVICAFCE
jgi:hypothetical protein